MAAALVLAIDAASGEGICKTTDPVTGHALYGDCSELEKQPGAELLPIDTESNIADRPRLGTGPAQPGAAGTPATAGTAGGASGAAAAAGEPDDDAAHEATIAAQEDAGFAAQQSVCGTGPTPCGPGGLPQQGAGVAPSGTFAPGHPSLRTAPSGQRAVEPTEIPDSAAARTTTQPQRDPRLTGQPPGDQRQGTGLTQALPGGQLARPGSFAPASGPTSSETFQVSPNVVANPPPPVVGAGAAVAPPAPLPPPAPVFPGP